MPTPFDWRVGVLNREPLYVCQYFMPKNHWQIVKHEADGRFEEGTFKTYAVEQAPREVVELGAARGGADRRRPVWRRYQADRRGAVVIEINDNPNLDVGVEDAVLKDELYRRLLADLVRADRAAPRPTLRRRGPPDGVPEAQPEVAASTCSACWAAWARPRRSTSWPSWSGSLRPSATRTTCRWSWCRTRAFRIGSAPIIEGCGRSPLPALRAGSARSSRPARRASPSPATPPHLWYDEMLAASNAADPAHRGRGALRACPAGR